jgi:hypothetical protein
MASWHNNGSATALIDIKWRLCDLVMSRRVVFGSGTVDHSFNIILATKQCAWGKPPVPLAHFDPVLMLDWMALWV